ncbi:MULTISPECIES: flavin reductase family protein [unclassified Microbacterium]|uniref:flavin reductase family protein n=1 Tax=unclassified Microbacterium TaxID=2609290 RepID=UPI00374672EF
MTSSQPSPETGAEATPAETPGRFGVTVTADDFKAVFRGHPGGVAVITAYGPEGPVALTASSVSSVSVDPPLLIFSVSSQSSATATIAAADTIVVHLLDAEDLPLAQLGATSGIDRFADTESWARLPTGEPVYRGVRAWVRCAIVSRMEAGGSVVIAAQALQASIGREVAVGDTGNALVYHNRTWHRLGEHSRVQ